MTSTAYLNNTAQNIVDSDVIPSLPGYRFDDPRLRGKFKGQLLTRHPSAYSGTLMAQRVHPKEVLTKHALEHSKKITLQSPIYPTMQLSTFVDDENSKSDVATYSRSINNSGGSVVDHQSSGDNTMRRSRIEPVPVNSGVLRFYAYSREEVTESPEETNRVHYVRIYVYLEDDTVMVEEQRIRNSGMDQGVILRRMRALNVNGPEFGTQYVASDFNVGINIELAGVVYRIYACDQYTEEYFAKKGIQLGEFETPPDDLYTIKRRLTERPIRVTHVNTDKANLRRFLEFDGKVLRFYATWDDTLNMFGEKRNFVLIYFLVDGSIEIRQVLPQNSGRDPVSQFLRKTILIKPGTKEPYTDADLYTGQTVVAFGRNFLIYDADEFTKNYLDSKYGPHKWKHDDLGPAVEQEIQLAKREYPPHNGWGDEEDSLGYCKSLHPKPPRKNMVKFLTKDGMVLRFAAKFSDPAPQDRERLFVIVFYLTDDTVAVFEKSQKNSGFAEGKFIQRTRIKNPSTGGYYQPQDFALGVDVNLNGFIFRTYDADEYALSYMEASSEEYPQSDLSQIFDEIRALNVKEQLRKQFEAKDPDANGDVPIIAAREIFMRVAGLSHHHSDTILRRFETPFGFNYYNFISALN